MTKRVAIALVLAAAFAGCGQTDGVCVTKDACSLATGETCGKMGGTWHPFLEGDGPYKYANTCKSHGFGKQGTAGAYLRGQ